jgi:ribosomal protein S18 acetylase RimI-like enzyme
MTEGIAYRINSASAGGIAEHLRLCDAQFAPKLSARVDIGEYAQKIADRAVRFEAWSEGSLIGLVAAYADDVVHRIAFITSVSVSSGWTGLGIGSRLMHDCIEYAKLNGMREVRLDVAAGQRAAVRLYEKCGFSGDEARAGFLRMHLELEGESDERA